MKNSKTWFAALGVSLIISSSVQAASKPAPAPAPAAPAAPTAPTSVTVDLDYIRKQVLSSNISLEEEMSTVKEQKDNLNIKRAQLLPSLDLSALLSGSGPSFILSQIQFLLPFLIPSNWFAMDAAADQFNAEEISYKVLELNVLASALSMYFTIQADYQNQAIYLQQAQDLMSIYQVKKAQSDLMGTVPPEQLAQTLASAQLAQVSASQLLELALQETDMFRQVLGLPLGTTINFTWVDMAPSTWEGKPVADQVTNAGAVAPEFQQLTYLARAAKQGKLNAAFGFLNSATASSQSQGGKNASFGNMNGGLSFHFGLDYFPTLSLNNQKEVDIELQVKQLDQDITQTVQIASDSLTQASIQYATAKAAEDNATDAYMILKQKYDLGYTDLISLLTAHQTIATASTARVRAEQDLNMQRVSLHRSMITDQFAQVQGCKAAPIADKGGLFHKSPPKKSLVDVCTEGGSRL